MLFWYQVSGEWGDLSSMMKYSSHSNKGTDSRSPASTERDLGYYFIVRMRNALAGRGLFRRLEGKAYKMIDTLLMTTNHVVAYRADWMNI